MDRITLLFEACQTKEELRQHIRAFLKIDLPDSTIDEDSTSNPMQMVWEVYSMMLHNRGNTAHVAACSRNTAKTLTSSILHFYALIHFRRSCLQLSATLEQSQSALNYLNKFLTIPELADYSEVANQKTKRLTGMPPNVITSKPDAEIRVAVATLKGTNSQRCNFLVCDEVDLTEQAILDEVIFVVDPVPYNQFEPVVVWLSSRKSNSGPIQNLIEQSTDPEKDIRLHKWSVTDWMQKCPDKTHRPDLPRKKALINLDTLEVFWDEEKQATVNPALKTNMREVNAFHGCEKCPAFLVCQARTPKQTSTSSMLRTIKFVGGVLRKVRDKNVIISQYLNLKPETTGIVFKSFSWAKHVRGPVGFYEWAIGQKYNPRHLDAAAYEEALHSKVWSERRQVTPTPDDIYQALYMHGWDISHGIDYGYSPSPATDVVVAYNKKQGRSCVFHVEASTGYDNKAWSEYVSTGPWMRFTGNFIAPDMADPAAPSYFGKYRIPTINTKPHLIETGVSQLRGLLWNVASQTNNFCILDDGKEDGGLRTLINAFEKWTHKRTPLGFNFDKYEDDDHTHVLDALRYALAPYVKQMSVSIAAKQPNTSLVDQYRMDVLNKMTPEARAAAVEAEAKMQMERFFKENHGLDKIFSHEEKMKEWNSVERMNAEMSGNPLPSPDDDGPSKPQKKSGIKISF